MTTYSSWRLSSLQSCAQNLKFTRLHETCKSSRFPKFPLRKLFYNILGLLDDYRCVKDKLEPIFFWGSHFLGSIMAAKNAHHGQFPVMHQESCAWQRGFRCGHKGPDLPPKRRNKPSKLRSEKWKKLKISKSVQCTFCEHMLSSFVFFNCSRKRPLKASRPNSQSFFPTLKNISSRKTVFTQN